MWSINVQEWLVILVGNKTVGKKAFCINISRQSPVDV